VPFEGGVIDSKLHFGVENPPKLPIFPPNAEFPDKSIHSTNFQTVRNRRKISTNHLYEIGVGALNRDASFLLPCPLAADFECPPVGVSQLLNGSRR
jgi:hypothetical protein